VLQARIVIGMVALWSVAPIGDTVEIEFWPM